MPVYTVCGYEYGEGFADMLARRLAENGLSDIKPACGGRGVSLEVSEAELDPLARALAKLLTRDLRVCELARLTCLLPASLREMESILPLAYGYSQEKNGFETAERELRKYLASERLLVAEGFLRFRLQSVLDDWAEAVDRAGEELLLRGEFKEVMKLIAAVAEAESKACRAEKVRLVLYPDGTAALTDGDRFRIESSCSDEGCIIGLLLGLVPASVEIYDLTDGQNTGLLFAIRTVFGDKARIFVKQDPER